MNLDTNRILLLSLIDISHREGWLGITKLQKLSFLTDYKLFLENKRVFSYEFFMYDHGPISKGVYDDFQFLLNNGLIMAEETGISLTNAGDSILREFQEVIPKSIITAMQIVAEKFAGLRSRELVDRVHEMEVRIKNGKIIRIDELDKNTTILPGDETTIFTLTDDLKETFMIMADAEIMQHLRKSRKKGSTSEPYKPLISS